MLSVMWCVAFEPWRTILKRVFFDSLANAFGSDNALMQVGVEQKRGKFVTAKTRRRVTAAQTRHYREANLLDSFTAGQMAISCRLRS